MRIRIPDECFGELLPAINNEKIKDICWNGTHIWVDHIIEGRYRAKKVLSNEFVNAFCMKVSNLSSRNFNMMEPFLEVETDNLKISMIHGAVTNTGTSFAIRKIPPVRRMSTNKMIKEGYASKVMLALFAALIEGHCSFIVAGAEGSGKTELVRYLTKYIPADERVVSIEDDFELRLSRINPEIDIIELKPNGKHFDVSVAIKAALMQFSQWLLLSELRPKDAGAFLNASTVCSTMTTMCANSVSDAINKLNAMTSSKDGKSTVKIADFLDVLVNVETYRDRNGNRKKRISQIGVIDKTNANNDKANPFIMIFNNGFTGATLPKNLWDKVEENATDEQLELLGSLRPKTEPQFANKTTGDLDGFERASAPGEVKPGVSENLVPSKTGNLAGEDEFRPANSTSSKKKEVKKEAPMQARKYVTDKAEELRLAVEILEIQKRNPNYHIPANIMADIRKVLAS